MAECGIESIAVILPARNEAAHIERTLRDLSAALEPTGLIPSLIVVSDGSTDDTVRRASTFPSDYVQVIELPVNMGKGAALKAGHQAAKGDLIAFLDADGDIDPASLAQLAVLTIRSGADGYVGSKTHPDSIVSYPKTRRIQSAAFRGLIRRSFRMNVGDTQTGAKVFRRRVLDETLPYVNSTGFEFDLELLALAHRFGFDVREGPVLLDFQFTSTVKWHDAISVLLGAWRVRRRLSQHPIPSDLSRHAGAPPGR